MEKMKKECPNKLLTVLMVVCVSLSVIILGIISYDKFIKKDEKVKDNNYNCPVCEKCSNAGKQDEELEVCVLDMNLKTTIDVNEECGKMGIDNTNVIIKNISVNGKVYELKHQVELDDSTDDSQIAYDNEVTKLYINGKLLDAYPGHYRNALMAVKVENNKLILSETFPSDVPAADHEYDLSHFD